MAAAMHQGHDPQLHHPMLVAHSARFLFCDSTFTPPSLLVSCGCALVYDKDTSHQETIWFGDLAVKNRVHAVED